MLKKLLTMVVLVFCTACSQSSGPTQVGPNRTVTIGPDQTAQSLVDTAGYSWSTSGDLDVSTITAPLIKRTETMVLVVFNRSISSQNAIEEMKSRHLHPANVYECLAFGATIADVRSKYSIACLGQYLQGGDSGEALYIESDDSDLNWGLVTADWGKDWYGNMRFLAVRD